ncbi:non-ribosomal peptide synthetase [Raineyella sp.]|uniref:Plipastatin synthase subunit D n=1 Tax=bioreactor metagenome TaxID=1076179 RepID=A0A644XU18_9ZZZZ|nr:non-ribosomal peptide synthetase [Raineyella sp.]MEA5153826.1 non-ribosomal peptide synthetase [Raineyella sp.]
MHPPLDLMTGSASAADLSPSEPCLVTADGQFFTWQDLRAGVRAWRDWLSRGDVADRVVVARLDLSFSAVALMTAAVTQPVRVAWLPLGLPAARERDMVACLNPETILVDETLAASVATAALASSGEASDAETGIDLTWSDEAKFIYFTSGSEGVPKAVQVGMGAIRNRIEWMWDQYPFDPSDRVVIQKPLSFVASYWEVLGSVLGGVSGVLVRGADRSRPDRFYDVVVGMKATHLFSTPPALRGLAEMASEQSASLSSLKFVCSSADVLTSDVVQRFYAAAPRARLLNLYGATETTANTTVFEVPRTAKWPERLPLGRPIPNTRIVVRDAEGNEVDDGQEGLICIQGAPVADGYVDGGRLIAGDGVFIRDGSGCEVRTGDLGYLENNSLHLTGRRDNAVNMSGYKIHLEEIEAAARKLADAPGPCGAVYLDAAEEQSLALVIPRDWEQQVTHQALSQLLPPYMVPQQIVPADPVPTVRTGKVDRSGCRALISTRGSAPRTDTPAQDPHRAAVERLWSAALDQGSGASAADFFASGGDSLRAVRLLASLRKELGFRIPLRAFYANPTISCLVALLASHVDGGEGLEA